MGNADSNSASAPAAAAAAPAATKECDKPQVGKSGKKICCSCPDTKRARDDCVVNKGPENCEALIEAHKECLRGEGFTVK